MGEYDKKSLKAAPTAGPSRDDRYGPGPVCENAEARIIGNEVAPDGRVLITIAKGKSHGARPTMEGYIKSGLGMLAEFQLHEVRPNASLAFVSGIVPDQLTKNPMVVINPTSRPRIANDPNTRLIDARVENGKTRITIPRGTLHGIRDGMTGEVGSGADSRSFTIDHTDTIRSYADVKDTVDHVRAHPQVRLHTSGAPRGSTGAAIQPRAIGAPATADVQSAAQAGVAGAASRLPHFDAIQRAFGKHDISGIQAQVGGPAADASRSLGAQAYATGNKVAFASAPDLHTAAHEAAHTIQQSRGAVGFQGLGAADDEHERHADAVADAVVAGGSAEPLLDQLGSGGSSGSVQRKLQDPNAMTNEQHTALVELSLQQAAESAEAALQKNHSPDLLNAAMRAVSRVAQALDTLDVPAPAVDARRLGPALDVTYVALDRLHTKMSGHSMLRGRSDLVVASIMDAFRNRFQPLGWRAPKDAKEGADRSRAGTALGKEAVSGEEYAQLATLHLRAARQYVLEQWSKIASGEVRDVAGSLVRHLQSVSEVLLDPRMAPASNAVATELDAFEVVFERVFVSLEKSHPAALVGLARAARETDAVRRLITKEPRWTAKVPYTPPPAATSTQPNGTSADAFSHADDDLRADRHPIIPFCHGKDTSVPGCSQPDIRPYLMLRFTNLILNAKSNYKFAATKLHIQELLKKEDDLHWLLTLALEIAGGHILSLASGAVVALKAAGAAKLAATIAAQGANDTSAMARASMLLKGISDEVVKSKVKAAYDPAKKAALAGIKSAANSEETTAKAQNGDFLGRLMNGCDATFGEFEVATIKSATDEDLVVLLEGLDERHHTIDAYMNLLAAKLSRFRGSGVLEIGREQGHELRVVWVEQPDRSKILRYQSNQLSAPETVTHMIRTQYNATRETGDDKRAKTVPKPVTPFGMNRSAAPRLGVPVPAEFRETALARSEQVWGPTPTILDPSANKPPVTPPPATSNHSTKPSSIDPDFDALPDAFKTTGLKK